MSSPGQTIAKFQHNISQHYKPSICKLRPNDRNNWRQQKKTKKQFNTTYRNIVSRNTLPTFGHPVATCCEMLGIENRTSAQARTQHCCTSLAKRLQHHATSTNVAWKIWPFSNLSQQHPTCRNMSRLVTTGWPKGRNILLPTILRYFAALTCCDRLAGGRAY